MILANRGHWRSFCAERLQTSSVLADDLWVDDDVSEHPADRTSGNWVRYYVRSDDKNPSGE